MHATHYSLGNMGRFAQSNLILASEVDVILMKKM